MIGNLVREVRSGAQTPSSAQSETLGLLDHHGPLSVSAMAQHRHVKHQSMRLVVAQLEQQHLVTRALDPTDARKQLIGLSAEGRAALGHSRLQRADWLARRLEESASSAQLKTLAAAIQILEKLLSDDQRT